jgi:hypothetical protein
MIPRICQLDSFAWMGAARVKASLTNDAPPGSHLVYVCFGWKADVGGSVSARDRNVKQECYTTPKEHSGAPYQGSSRARVSHRKQV